MREVQKLSRIKAKQIKRHVTHVQNVTRTLESYIRFHSVPKKVESLFKCDIALDDEQITEYLNYEVTISSSHKLL